MLQIQIKLYSIYHVRMDIFCSLTLRPGSKNPLLHTGTIKIITLQILIIKNMNEASFYCQMNSLL